MTDPIRESAAELLDAAASRAAPDGFPKAVVGFDGFVDTIARAVGSRHSMQPDGYDPLPTITAFGGRISAAAGRSMNMELVALEARGGGNGPLMAGALASLGVRVTLIGALGGGDSAEPTHPAYDGVLKRCARARSIGPTGRTDALEFDDGKVMFNWSAPLLGIDYDHLTRALGGGDAERGETELAALLTGASLLATVNWTNMGGLGSIWAGLRERVFPRLAHQDKPALFVDLSDPAKRSDVDLRTALHELTECTAVTEVTLGLNISEASRLRSLLGLSSEDVLPEPDSMMHAAASIRVSLGLHAVAVHTRTGAGGSVVGEEPGAVRTRAVDRPVLSTGAGDHFNGGFTTARLLGLPLAESLACGCDTASHLVRTGSAPSLDGLIAELRSSV